jgi:hypothetical protein
MKRYEVRSFSTYHIVVNGVITDLPYSFTSREYTMTADVVDDSDGGHPAINQWADLPWVDIGYDADGNALEETNRQLSRIFSTTADNSLVIGFDIWDTKSKHDLIYDDSNPSYKYLWPVYDTALGSFPPLIDLLNIEERKWMMFTPDGEYNEIDTPKIAGVDYERVNGLLMVRT